MHVRNVPRSIFEGMTVRNVGTNGIRVHLWSHDNIVRDTSVTNTGRINAGLHRMHSTEPLP